MYAVGPLGSTPNPQSCLLCQEWKLDISCFVHTAVAERKAGDYRKDVDRLGMYSPVFLASSIHGIAEPALKSRELLLGELEPS